MNSFSTRIFLRRVLPYFGVCAIIIIVLLIFKWNDLGIFGGDFVASLRLPGGTAKDSVKLAGKELSTTLFGEKQGLSAFQHLVYSKGYKIITQILGAVAVLAMVYYGIKMIVSNSNEERVKEARHAILMIFMGLAIVAIADVVVKEVFVLSGGTFMSDEASEVLIDGKSLTQMQRGTYRFNEQIHIIITFLRYITQGVAFFFIIRSGLALIVGGQQSDVLDTQKKVFMWGIVGLVFIMAADTVVKKVIFPVEYGKELVVGKVQVETGISLIAQLINMFLAFAGGVAVFSLIAGATMYVSAIGHEQSTEKGKKIVVGSLMGLVIIFSAYTIVAEFIR